MVGPWISLIFLSIKSNGKNPEWGFPRLSLTDHQRLSRHWKQLYLRQLKPGMGKKKENVSTVEWLLPLLNMRPILFVFLKLLNSRTGCGTYAVPVPERLRSRRISSLRPAGVLWKFINKRGRGKGRKKRGEGKRGEKRRRRGWERRGEGREEEGEERGRLPDLLAHGIHGFLFPALKNTLSV